MKTISLLCFLGFATIVLAEETAPPAATPPPFELKNKSSFNAEVASRSPFWPIGYRPAIRKAGDAERSGPEIPSSAFTVTSIMLDPGAHFAIVNGKIMQEGQQFGLKFGNQVYQITLKAIQDGQIVLQRRDEEIIVPLTRK